MPKYKPETNQDSLVDFMFKLTDEVRQECDVSEAVASKMVGVAVKQIQGKYGKAYVYVHVNNNAEMQERNEKIKALKGVKKIAEVSEEFGLSEGRISAIWGSNPNYNSEVQEGVKKRNLRIVQASKEKPDSIGKEAWFKKIGDDEGISSRQVRNIIKMS